MAGTKKRRTFAPAFHKRGCKTLGYGVMVTLQILVLSFLVRVRVPQHAEAAGWLTINCPAAFCLVRVLALGLDASFGQGKFSHLLRKINHFTWIIGQYYLLFLYKT